MGGGGMGGGMVAAQEFPQTMTQTALSELITMHVEPNEWVQLGGEGSLSIVGSMMIISQTDAVHAEVDQFLSLLRKSMGSETSVEVDVRVIELAADANLGEAPTTADQLSKLASDPSAARLSLRCNNHQVSQVSSGVRRSYVVSITPVVGGNDQVSGGRGTAYQPTTTSLLLGMRGKIQPDIATDQKTGRIHMGIALASGPEDVVSANFGTGQTIDRVELEIAELETAVVASVDQWTLAGTVAVCDPTTNITSGQALPHLVVLVKWKLVP